MPSEDISHQELLIEIERLRKECALKNKLLESSAAFFVAIDLNGRILMMNQVMLQALGYSEKEVLGTDYLSTFVPEIEREAVSTVFNRLMKMTGPTVSENHVVTKDGRAILVEWHGKTMINGDGDPEYFFGTGIDVSQRASAEQALRNEKEIIDTALDAQLDTFFLFEPATGKTLRWNKAFRDISGCTDEEISRLPAPDSYYGPEDLERAHAFIQNVLKIGMGTIELDLICKDGRKIPTEYRVGIINDNEGFPKYIISIGRDLTERKKTEEELRNHQDMISALIETSKDWIWSIDTHGMHTYCNPAVKSILGYCPEEILNIPTFELIHEEDKEWLQDNLKDWVKRKSAWSNQVIRWRHKNGEWRYLESNAVPIIAPDGSLKGFRGVDRDITNRKLAEERIRESENRYRNLFEAVFDGIAIHDRGKLIEINSSFAHILGYDPEEMIGMDGLELVAPDDKERAMENIRNQYVNPYEISMIKKNGTQIEVEVIGRTISHKGRVARLTAVRDITERKRALRELKKSQVNLQAAQAIAHLGSWQLDVQNDVLVWSDEV